MIGFSVKGSVLAHQNGPPLSEATIFLDTEKKAVTTADGTYILEKVKAGTYSLSVKIENYQFEQRILRINPNLLELPAIFPSSYLVCGSVISEYSQIVTISRIGSTQYSTVNTKASTGKFCEYLKSGKYQVQVVVSSQDQDNGVQ